jgi:hypothetical protein
MKIVLVEAKRKSFMLGVGRNKAEPMLCRRRYKLDKRSFEIEVRVYLAEVRFYTSTALWMSPRFLRTSSHGRDKYSVSETIEKTGQADEYMLAIKQIA